jgi:hypothetical protein
MIAVMIDHKLSRYTEIIQYTFKFIFDTLGYSFRFIEKMNELKGHDILFCYSLLEPTVDEIHEFATNRLVFFAQAEIDLLVPDKLNSDDFHNYLQELRLFTPTPVICKKKIETPILMRSIGNIFGVSSSLTSLGTLFSTFRDTKIFFPNGSIKRMVKIAVAHNSPDTPTSLT